MTTDLSSARARQLWWSVGAPILLLVVALCAGAVAILSEFAHRQDREFEASSRQLVTSALLGRTRAQSNTTKDFAFWNDAYQAISGDWDLTWVEENYISSAADGLIVFGAERAVRYSWFGESAAFADADFAAAVVRQAASEVELRQLVAATDVGGMVASRLFNVNGHLLVVATAPVSLEDEAARSERDPAGRVDFVASIDVVDRAEITDTGERLGLDQLSFSSSPPSADGALIAMELPNAGASAGWLTWRNERPGSASFLSQLLPVMALTLLAGLVAIWVVRRSVARQLETMAHADAHAEANRAKSQFIATMSHELRTPLNAIIGYAEMVREELEAHSLPEVSEDVARVEKAGRHLLSLINDILDHSKVDADKLSLDIDSIGVAQALDEVRAIMAPLAQEHDNRLLVSIGPNVGCVYADHLRLQQCLLNLAGNAVKFTHRGEVRLHARRERVEGREVVLFEFSDTGIGIAPQALMRLFSPFVQADASITRSFGGTGLGLSITRKLARAMGGDVTARSVVGEGSTFTLLLPAAGAASVQEAA